MDGFFRDLVGDSDEEAHAWLSDFKKYITIQTLNVAAGRVGEVRATAFGAHIARGSEAETWYNSLTTPQQESWANLLLQLDQKWPAPPVQQRTTESYIDEFRACVLPRDEVLARFPTGNNGQTQWGYVLYASRMRHLGQKTQQSLSSLLVDIKKLIPPALVWLMRGQSGPTWKDWCTALGALTVEEVRLEMERTSEIEARLAKVEAVLETHSAPPQPPPPPPPAPQAAPRQAWQHRQPAAPQVYYQPAYAQFAPAPSAPMYIQYSQPPQIPVARPLPPLRAPPPQLTVQPPAASPNPFYTPSLPKTPQNTQRVEEERRAWRQQYPDGRPFASRAYPLTPGTAPAALGCTRCGGEVHEEDDLSCKNTPLDSLEQRYRTNVRTAIQRARPQSAAPRGSSTFTPSPLGPMRTPAFGRWSAPATPTPASPLHAVDVEQPLELQFIDGELDIDFSREPHDDEPLNGREVF